MKINIKGRCAMKRGFGRFLGIFVAVAPSFADMMMPGKAGMLSGFPGHNASGKASISKDGMGKTFLELTGIKVDKVPDGRVYLAKRGDYKKGGTYVSPSLKTQCWTITTVLSSGARSSTWESARQPSGCPE
jgi:hypothetical protein